DHAGGRRCRGDVHELPLEPPRRSRGCAAPGDRFARGSGQERHAQEDLPADARVGEGQRRRRRARARAHLGPLPGVSSIDRHPARSPAAVRSTDPVPGGSVAAAWAPLALSWAMMGIEQPVIAAVIARLPDPELSLAAYGGVVYPLALVIEAPIIMLLSASTELSRDRASYRALQAFTHRAGAVLTMLHLLVAATPLYEIIVASVFAVPEAVAREARLGLLMMLPWSWAIAWRRLGQGVLIRFGHSRTVGVGTLWRVAATGLTLAIGAWGGWSSGVVV